MRRSVKNTGVVKTLLLVDVHPIFYLFPVTGTNTTQMLFPN